MSEILFLSHRIPYPPDKGDKIRSYNLLRALSSRHTVHLGTFVDDPADWAHVDALRSLCGEVCVRPLNPVWGRLRGAIGLATGSALTMSYYRDRRLERWVRELGHLRRLAGVLAFSSSMGQYAAEVRLEGQGARVVDLCDIDSDKWRQFARSHRFPLGWVFGREARALARVEESYAKTFDATLVVSEAEASILLEQTGVQHAGVKVVPNGVDSDYFNPDLAHVDPFDGCRHAVVFTGAMDYHANIDAVEWFAREVFPQIRAVAPQAIFVIVGSKPTDEVIDLAKLPGVSVTGRVPDVRPYLAHAAVVVAPLRMARGVQNKVLEALAMSRPVVATENAVQGIPQATRAGVRISSGIGPMAEAVVECFRGPRTIPAARRFVQERFAWPIHLAAVLDLFESRERRRSDAVDARAAGR